MADWGVPPFMKTPIFSSMTLIRALKPDNSLRFHGLRAKIVIYKTYQKLQSGTTPHLEKSVEYCKDNMTDSGENL